MLIKLFPIKIHLNILQLFEYNLTDFWRWIVKNLTARQLEGKKPLIITSKIRLIFILSIVWLLAIFLLIGQWSWLWSVVISILILTQDYLLITLAYLIIWPFDYFAKQQIKQKTRQKILSLKKNGLKVIGITGSFGKTTTKEFLYQLLRQKYQVLRTSESFNTALGIAKVVDLELDDRCQFFICEYGAYKKGSIKELVEMVPPDFGILTGINEQHLEQIGTIDGIIKEKFSMIESMDPRKPIVINLGNKHIVDNYRKFDRNYIIYGTPDSTFNIQHSTFQTDGSKFDLILNNKKYPARAPVFGQSNLLDILAAATMAYQLDIEPKIIIESLKTIRPVAHRLEVKQFKSGITYIDNAFSSNVDGFKLALDFLQTFQKRPKILVTPGIILLGDRSADIHRQLGLIASKVCDRIILVGQNERTKALEEGIKDEKKVIYIKKIADAWPQVEILQLKNPVVLFENDLPDNY